MTHDNKALFLTHALIEMPREACAVLIIEKGREVLIKCKNLSPLNNSFMIDPSDYAIAEDRGEVVAVVHSHCYGSAMPSEADLVSCEATRLEWHILSVPNGDWHSFKPSGYIAPLVGRQWAHGLLDCYSLIRDYYREKLGVELMDFERDFEWWLNGRDLYAENFKKAGFYEVPIEDVKEHDVLLMQVASPVINHGGIYLGNDTMLHHLHRRLSCREIFGGYYLRHCVKVVRYANG